MEETVVVDNREKEIKKERKPWIGEEASQKLFFVLLMLVIFLTPITRIISDIFPWSDYMIIQSTYMIIVFGLFTIIIFLEHLSHRVPWKKYRIVYACIFIMWLFSFIRSFDAPIPKIAFLGNAYRAEGLLQIGGYYVIFIMSTLLTNKRYRVVLLHSIMCLGVVFATVGVMQYLQICSFWWMYPGMASFGFGNPNFYSSFAIMFAGISMAGYWLYREDSMLFHPFSWWKKKIWLIFVLFSYIACISSRSTVAYVGIIMIFSLMIFLNIVTKKKNLSCIVLMLGLFLVVMLLLNALSDGGAVREFLQPIREIKEEGSIFGDSVGNRRMKCWKEIVALLPMYWLDGCGIEHLGYVHLFAYGMDTTFELVDKAHNEYLDLWITRGFVVIVTYLVYLFCLFIPGVLQYIKKKWYETDEIKMLVLFPFFGYIAQAFFNISVLPVAPFFWLLCGMLVMERQKSESVIEISEVQKSLGENMGDKSITNE